MRNEVLPMREGAGVEVWTRALGGLLFQVRGAWAGEGNEGGGDEGGNCKEKGEG
jgi:hypothetical protein